MQIKVLTWNIHHGQGIDLRISTKRIAEVIKKENPDVVGLNEVYKIPFAFDQPKRLTKLLGIDYIFQRNESFGPIGYGNLILSKEKIELVKDLKFPSQKEKRGCLIIKIIKRDKEFYFAATHLDAYENAKKERAEQLRAIKKELNKLSPIILAGDLNIWDKNELLPLHESYQNSGQFKTFPSGKPETQFDYIFYDTNLKLVSSHTVNATASDHLPLVAEFKLNSLTKVGPL